MNLNMNLDLNPGARCLRPDRSYFHPARRPVRGMPIRIGERLPSEKGSWNLIIRLAPGCEAQ